MLSLSVFSFCFANCLTSFPVDIIIIPPFYMLVNPLFNKILHKLKYFLLYKINNYCYLAFAGHLHFLPSLLQRLKVFRLNSQRLVSGVYTAYVNVPSEKLIGEFKQLFTNSIKFSFCSFIPVFFPNPRS